MKLKLDEIKELVDEGNLLFDENLNYWVGKSREGVYFVYDEMEGLDLDYLNEFYNLFEELKSDLEDMDFKIVNIDDKEKREDFREMVINEFNMRIKDVRNGWLG